MLKNECTRNCWLAAAVAGLLVWLFNMFGGLFFGGLLLGLITFFLMGNLLVWMLCAGRGGRRESVEVLGPRAIAHGTTDGTGGVLDRAETAVVNAGTAFATSAAAAFGKSRAALRDDDTEDDTDDDYDDDDRDPRHKDDDDLMDRVEDRLEAAGDAVKDAMGALAARGKAAIGAVRGGDDASAADSAPVGLEDGSINTAGSEPAPTHAGSDRVSPSGQAAIPTPASDAKPAAAGAEARKAAPARDKTEAPKAASAKLPAAKAKPATPATPAETAPKAAKPKAAKPKAEKPKPKAAQASADNLKEIKGVGPQLEKLLHENGITRFAEIAGWSDAEVDHFAEVIGRIGGRIRADDWVGQAKVLATGGETEFSARVDKGEVY